MKRKGTEIAPCSDALVLPLGSMGMGAVFDQYQVMVFTQRGETVEVANARAEMYTEDGSSPVSENLEYGIRVEGVVGAPNVCKNGNGADLHDGCSRGDERQGGEDYFVTPLDSGCSQSKLECHRAIGGADAVVRIVYRRKLLRTRRSFGVGRWISAPVAGSENSLEVRALAGIVLRPPGEREPTNGRSSADG